MLTLFTTPRPLEIESNRIAFRNAIRSWMRIIPTPEVLVFGGDKDIVEAEGGIYVDDFERATIHGHPFFDSFVRTAERLASNDLLMYATDHLILTYDLTKVIELVTSRFQESFIIIGRRWNIRLNAPIDFRPVGWDDALRQQALRERKYDSPGAKDYVIFPRPFPLEIPKFIVGYPWYDTWMVVAAQRAGIPVIDASRAIFPIHQQHAFREGTILHREQAPETRYNAALAEGMAGMGQTVSAAYMVTIFDVISREQLHKEERPQ